MTTDHESSPARDVRSRGDEGRVPCPRCGTRTIWRDNPHRPFCSLECRLIDLGAWLDERYRVRSEPGSDDIPDDVP